MRKLVLIVTLLVLGACDQSPATRQNLAQCEMDPKAKISAGGWDVSFLEICMQARAYSLDPNRCGALPFPQIEPGCYRSDTWYANLWRSISN